MTLHCLEKNTRVHWSVARYTCPIGAVFNKDGAAIYQVLVVLFFARLRDLELDPMQLFTMG